MTTSLSTPPLRGVVISDTHLFAGHARRSEKFLDNVIASLKRYDYCVWNGDILEVTVPGMTFPELFKHSSNKIRQLCEKAAKVNPNCEIHYVIGNHENPEEYILAVEALQKELPNLRVHRDYVVLGDAMFLHGDLPQYFNRLGARQVTDEKGAYPSILTALYSPIQKLETDIRNRTVPNITAVQKIARILRQNPLFDDILHVFSGHSHRAYTGMQEDGRNFYNTGALVDGAEANPLEFVIGAEGIVTEVVSAPIEIPVIQAKEFSLTDSIAHMRLTKALMADKWKQAAGRS